MMGFTGAVKVRGECRPAFVVTGVFHNSAYGKVPVRVCLFEDTGAGRQQEKRCIKK